MSPFALALDPAAPAPAGAPDRLGDRLQRCARYLELVAEQHAALMQHDAGRLRELAEERQQLEAELGIGGPDGEAPASPPHWQLMALLGAGLDELSREVEQDRRSRDYWAALQDEARVAARGIPARRLGRYAAIAPADARLDVRF